jgi:4-hydroxy-tetrahydrodipicolinate synthase
MQANFIESNPGPVKCAMAEMGLINETYRLPMVPPSDASRARIHAVLERMHLVAETAAR